MKFTKNVHDNHFILNRVVKYKNNNNTGETSSSGGTDLKTALAFYENVIERLKKMVKANFSYF